MTLPKKKVDQQSDLNAIVQQAVLSFMAHNEAQHTDAMRAAQTNQKYKFSVILGESHRSDRHVISEKLLQADYMKKYRLKVVQYRFFTSQEKLDEYCKKHYLTLEKYNDTLTQPDDEELFIMDD